MAGRSSQFEMLMVGSVLLLSLIIVGAEAGRAVNLIDPLFKEAKFEPNCTMVNCTIILRTRAAEYKLNTNLLEDKNGSMARIGEFKNPRRLIDTDFRFNSGQSAFTGPEYVKYVREKLKGIKEGRMIAKDLSPAAKPSTFLICEARTEFEIDKRKASACARDTVILIQIDGNDFKYKVDSEQFNLPLSAIAIQASPVAGKQNDYQLDMVTFDLAGVVNVFTASYNSGPNSTIAVTRSKKFTLSPHLGILRDFETQRASWVKMLYSNDIYNKLAYNREHKIKSAYVQSITREGADGTICFTQRPMSALEDICWKKNSTVKLNPSFKSNDNARIFIHAHHRSRKVGEEKSNVHLAYSMKNTQFNVFLYIYCPSSYNKPELELDIATSTNIRCEPEEISIPPNDIIGFEDGNCSRTIAFYDSIYTVHPDDKSILEADIGEPKVLEGLDFYISAAYTVGKTIHFFTGTNALVMVNATLTGPNCSTLNLDLANKVVTTSQEHLYPRAFLKEEGSMELPYLFDWRDFAAGDNDTSPGVASDWNSIAASNKPDVTTTIPPPTFTTPKPKLSGESNVVIIAVGLILGGLIIAAIVYLFCLRGTAEDRPPLRRNKSRRAKTPPMGLDSGAAMSSMKTVRSEHGMTTKSPMSKVGSKIIGSSIGPQKSRGSRRSKRSAGAKQQQPQQQPQQQAPAPQEISAAPIGEAQATSTSPATKSPKSQRSSSPSAGFLKKTLSSPKSPKSTRKNKSPRAAKTLVANP